MKIFLLKLRFFVIVGVSFVFWVFFGQFLTWSASSYVVDWDLITAENRNQLLTTLDTAIWRSWPESLTASPWDTLWSAKWNDLVTKVNNYTSLSWCLADNWGNCKIIATNKSLVESDLVAENIKSWINIFGITGNMMDFSTLLLLHFDNNFLDKSYLNNSVSNSSSTFSSTISKFWWYSVYLDGSSYLSIPDSDTFKLWSKDFTVDFWFKTTDTAWNFFQFPYWAWWNWRDYFSCQVSSNKFHCYIWQSSSVNNYMYGTSVINDNQWHHAAIVRSWTNISIYIDWNREVSQTMNYTFSYPTGNTFKLWAERSLAAAWKYSWYIDEFRIVRYRAIWTNNFTVPSTQHTN